MSDRGPKPAPLLNNPPVNLEPPAWLTAVQKQIWREAFLSAPAGLLVEMDASLLTAWVVASDLHRQACEESQKLPLIVKSPNKEVPMQNPYLAIINRQSEIMTKCAGELGFTPISRTRMSRLGKAPARKILQDEPMGKKAKADAEAKVAQQGTDWQGLLDNPPPQIQ
ncbi:MAG: phage terminase small subunit P27 family [Bradyrhizobium sp.]